MNSMGEVAVRCVLLVATDGVYDMMSNDDAVIIAFKHWGNPAAAAEEMIVETGRKAGVYDFTCYKTPCIDAAFITHGRCGPHQSIS